MLPVFTTKLPALADEPDPEAPVCSVSVPPAAADVLPWPLPDVSVSPDPATEPAVPSALPSDPTVIDWLNVAARDTCTELFDTVITGVPAGASVRSPAADCSCAVPVSTTFRDAVTELFDTVITVCPDGVSVVATGDTVS